MGELKRLTNCTNGGPVFFDVKDDKIVRITPLEFDDSDSPFSSQDTTRGGVYGGHGTPSSTAPPA